MIFLDIVDLFERSMTAHQDYKKLHDSFDAYRILPQFHSLIILLGDELHRIGIALKVGFPSTPTDLISKEIEKVNNQFNALRDQERNSENIESFISLRHILNSIEDIAERIYTLHRYTTFDPDLSNQFKVPVAYDNFVTHSAIDFRLLLSNLSLRSSNFRHALRVSIAMLTGFIVSQFLPFGHSYWILLTIIVIVKPGYAQTKNRSYERLLGTIAGAVLGFILLYFVQDKQTLLVVMILCMIGTFSFMRFRYIVGVVLMTPYVLILFHLLFGGSSNDILYERVIDTAIGSAIAFLANYLLVPNWAHTQLRQDMAQAIHDNCIYLKDVAGAFAGHVSSVNEFKLARKNAFVSQANLTDSFNKMLSEPNDKKKHSKQIHQFVVLNHMLTSHIATVSYYVQPLAAKYQQPVLGKLTKAIVKELEWIEHHLLSGGGASSGVADERASAGMADEQTSSGRGDAGNGSIIAGNVSGIIEGGEKVTAVPSDQHISGLMKQLSHEVFLLREVRSTELAQGIMDSSVRKQLSEYKSIADQFLFIARTSTELQKNVLKIPVM